MWIKIQIGMRMLKKNKENNSIHIKVFKRITNICCDEGKNSCTFHLSNRI